MIDRTFFTLNFQSPKRTFRGFLGSDGPLLIADGHRRHEEESLLGIYTFVQNFTPLKTKEDWWIAKDEPPNAVSMQGLTPQQVIQVADAFGVLFWEPHLPNMTDFYASAAFRGLVKWVRDHPRVARQVAPRQAYCPHWYRRALAADGKAPAFLADARSDKNARKAEAKARAAFLRLVSRGRL
jgi:hypothetical protein